MSGAGKYCIHDLTLGNFHQSFLRQEGDRQETIQGLLKLASKQAVQSFSFKIQLIYIQYPINQIIVLSYNCFSFLPKIIKWEFQRVNLIFFTDKLLQMSQQNKEGVQSIQADTIQSQRIYFDKDLLSKKKEIIEQFLRGGEDSTDAITRYPNQILRDLAQQQLKNSCKIEIHKSFSTLYFGEVCNQLYHGYGLLIYKSNQLRFYQGYFQNNCKYGYGLQYINGDLYIGKFINNKPEDQNGIFLWANGDIYHGSFINGMKHGQGKWQSGDQFYSGAWKYNKPEGQGFIKSSLSQYKGEIKNGYKHGKGMELFNNGDRYQGNYSNGKPQGEGNYYWSNGSTYKGQFKNGLRFGTGVWQFGGEKYEGTYINDKRNGHGKYTWGGGSFYQGNFVEDLRHGYGQMHWDNQSFYKGQWFEGSQNGQGQVWQAGKLIQKGFYETGKLKIQTKEQDSQRRLLPYSTLNRKIIDQNQQTYSQRKRFNSYNGNKQSLKFIRANKQHNVTQNIKIPIENQKLQRLRSINKRYTGVANKSKGKNAAKSMRMSPKIKEEPRAQSKKEAEEAHISMNKINLYRRVRKEKPSQTFGKKIPPIKIAKNSDIQALFQTQLGPIKWRNFSQMGSN